MNRHLQSPSLQESGRIIDTILLKKHDFQRTRDREIGRDKERERERDREKA